MNNSGKEDPPPPPPKKKKRRGRGKGRGRGGNANKYYLRPLQVGFLFLVSNFPKSGEGKREIRNLETFLLPVSGQPVIRPTMHTAVH